VDVVDGARPPSYRVLSNPKRAQVRERSSGGFWTVSCLLHLLPKQILEAAGPRH